MNPISRLQTAFTQSLSKTLSIPLELAQTVSMLAVQTDDHKESFGDLSSTAPMSLARHLKKNPRMIAQEVVTNFTHEYVERIEFAGAGYLNFFLTHEAYALLAAQLYEQKAAFFKPTPFTKKQYSIEFVSANPTGPLHFGHGRGGIIGDVLGNILTFLGHDVTKEFYINDAGAQITKLGASLRARYLQATGTNEPIPEDGYQGDYLILLAQALHALHGNALQEESATYFAHYAKQELLRAIEKTLSSYGIHYDVWFSEKVLHDTGAIDHALATLKERGFLYEQDGASWFTATQFGDDKDRVVKKQDGELTYVAADIAYLQNKVERGNRELIMVLGHDHHSYSTRLQAALCALGLDTQANLSVILYQLVTISQNNEQLRMSKRKGTIVTLDDVIETVGVDIARFFYLYRKADAQLDFNLDIALTQTDENPVYYLQYAYVRTNSIMHKALQHVEFAHISAADAVGINHAEHLILRKIWALTETLRTIETTHQTHILAYYAHELAQLFSRYYGKHTVIDLEQVTQTRARLVMVQLVHNTLALVFDLLGISKPERM